MPQTPPQQLTVPEELLNWSQNRPTWQRDALRRIIVAGRIELSDVDEFLHLCRAPHGANEASANPIEAIPLDKSHIPSGVGAQHVTSLVSLGGLVAVNRLPTTQTLKFGGAPGLTIIYGDNGSGKSGYARVLKKACRSRGASPTIRPDAFAPPTTVPASGILTFRVGTTEISAPWTDGNSCDERLGNAFFFDALTAGNYLEQDGPASFTPHGLDILPKLSKLCDTIRDSIKKSSDSTKLEISSVAKGWTLPTGTIVSNFLSTLSAETKATEITALAGIDSTEERRLKDLNETLRTDPKQKAKETRASANRLRAFAGLVKNAADSLSSVAVATIKTAQEQAKSTATVAKAFTEGKFDSSHLTGTGEEFWRKLWDAAHEYSKSAAYPGEEFPVTHTGALCVLCQQPLSVDASERLIRFHTFCADKSQELALSAAKKLKLIKEEVAKLTELDAEYKMVEIDLSAASAEQSSAFATFVTTYDSVLKVVKENFESNVWVETLTLPVSLEATLNELASALDLRAKEEDSASDPVTRKTLESERDELSGREWLGKNSAEVLLQVERYKTLKALDACQKDATTAAITSKNSALTKQLVTDAFCAQFDKELAELGLTTLGVQLHDIAGTKGETKFGLRLNPESTLLVKDVASEGEQRCVALAAFLAELSQSPHKSSLVFDDPVSSLDHYHREKIAIRLANESRSRQVIVFTHEAVFVDDLCESATTFSVNLTCAHLAWNGKEPGHCIDGLPWDCKSIKDRFNVLDRRYIKLKASWGLRPSEEDIMEMRQTYSWLRQTIERMIEKVVFADVVFRFRPYVNMKRLEEVVGFSRTEFAEIQRLFGRCSDITDAHDRPQPKQSTAPTPAELKIDLDATAVLHETIRNRQKLTLAAAKDSR